jgi:hypothetical protein
VLRTYCPEGGYMYNYSELGYLLEEYGFDPVLEQMLIDQELLEDIEDELEI